MVFSGIVEEIGTVASLVEADDVLLWDGSRGKGTILTVNAVTALDGAYNGASIAVNGTCLTVTSFTDKQFTVGLAPETLRRTNLGDLKPGDHVNLERSLPADGRNSGHYVQGHVDDTGTLDATWRDGDSLWVRIAIPPALLPFIVPKGYIAVDGTSLTVCEVCDGATSAGSSGGTPPPITPGVPYFTLMLIAYTQQHVVLPLKRVGSRINLEADVMAKYASKQQAVAASGAASAGGGGVGGAPSATGGAGAASAPGSAGAASVATGDAIKAAVDAAVAAALAAAAARIAALEADVAELKKRVPGAS